MAAQTFAIGSRVTALLRLNFEAMVKEINDNGSWFLGKKTTRVFLTAAAAAAATGRPS